MCLCRELSSTDMCDETFDQRFVVSKGVKAAIANLPGRAATFGRFRRNPFAWACRAYCEITMCNCEQECEVISHIGMSIYSCTMVYNIDRV
jgi:hypothetical protein